MFCLKREVLNFKLLQPDDRQRALEICKSTDAFLQGNEGIKFFEQKEL